MKLFHSRDLNQPSLLVYKPEFQLIIWKNKCLIFKLIEITWLLIISFSSEVNFLLGNPNFFYQKATGWIRIRQLVGLSYCLLSSNCGHHVYLVYFPVAGTRYFHQWVRASFPWTVLEANYQFHFSRFLSDIYYFLSVFLGIIK